MVRAPRSRRAAGLAALALICATAPAALAAFGGTVKAGGSYGGGEDPSSYVVGGVRLSNAKVVSLFVSDDAKQVTVFLDGAVGCSRTTAPERANSGMFFGPVSARIRRDGSFRLGDGKSFSDSITFPGRQPIDVQIRQSFTLRGRFDGKGRATGRLSTRSITDGLPGGRLDCRDSGEPIRVHDTDGFPRAADGRLRRAATYAGEAISPFGSFAMTLRTAARGRRVAGGSVLVPYNCESFKPVQGEFFAFLERIPAFPVRRDRRFAFVERFDFVALPEGRYPDAKKQATMSFRGRFPGRGASPARGTIRLDIDVTDRQSGERIDKCTSGDLPFALSR